MQKTTMRKLGLFVTGGLSSKSRGVENNNKGIQIRSRFSSTRDQTRPVGAIIWLSTGASLKKDRFSFTS